MAPVPRFCQIALCSSNVPRSVELYTRPLGFAESGSVCLFGTRSALVQELGDDAAGHVTWLTGRQDFMQLEVFHHTEPAQRPLPADWRPSDHGYVRWGVAVGDFDGCLARLLEYRVETITKPITFADDVRRVCFRDPYVGAIVEVLEDGPTLPGGVRPRDFRADPAVVYAALSVADLAPARAFFGEALGLAERQPDFVHRPEMEVLWGLEGALVERVVYDAGSAALEVCCYRDPQGRPKPADYRLSDQGILNVGLGFRTREEFDTLLTRLDDIGYRPSAAPGPPRAPAAGYFHTDDGTSVELLGIAEEFNDVFGYAPRPSVYDVLGTGSRA